jgi:hypothetical protein
MPVPETDNNTQPDPVAEAERLRDQLHDALAGMSRLLTALKLHRRQAKAVAEVMASLKQIQFDH